MVLSTDALKSKDLFFNKFRLLRILLLALIRQAQAEGALVRKAAQLKDTEPYKFPSKGF